MKQDESKHALPLHDMGVRPRPSDRETRHPSSPADKVRNKESNV